jgi:hypothetical protein
MRTDSPLRASNSATPPIVLMYATGDGDMPRVRPCNMREQLHPHCCACARDAAQDRYVATIVDNDRAHSRVPRASVRRTFENVGDLTECA